MPKRRFKLLLTTAHKRILFSIVLLGALGVLGFGVLQFLESEEHPAPQINTARVLPKPISAPVTTTKAVIANLAEGRTAAANEVLAETSGAAPSPASGVVETTTVSAPEMPQPVANQPASPRQPSVAFAAWVRDAQISGVRSGVSPRVFIERSTYGVGDLVNPQLGITFVGYDSETRLLTFKDDSGAIAERRY